MGGAIQEVLEGNMGYRRASKAYSVPQTTLERKVKEARQKKKALLKQLLEKCKEDIVTNMERKGIHEKTPYDVTACRREYLRTAPGSEVVVDRLGAGTSLEFYPLCELVS
ncbi:hypothetical protein AVEN_126558-1 [Araneus ventricosus]|uniref:HTH psq-type domain-containing protein n=1 Tax=Araneus ventricosus TaxID=182803 RepID=A0A4Y2LG57_ARAVE|nr:hypothetical protein AVEN_126558-1 [Araneus ventricosus]